MIYNFSGSGSGNYSLVATSTNQPASTTTGADGNVDQESECAAVVPLRPAPPSKPVTSDRKSSSVCISQHSNLPLGFSSHNQ